jgi:hypothetical protein
MHKGNTRRGITEYNKVSKQNPVITDLESSSVWSTQKFQMRFLRHIKGDAVSRATKGI